MIKNYLLLLLLASVAVWMGCARGTQSIAPVTVTGDKSVVAVSLTANFSAKINGTPSTAVNWSLSSNSCSGSACGLIDSTGIYTAPTTLPTGKKSMSVTVIATSQADAAATGQATITVLPITVYVTPTPVQVGQGLVQQFTAVAVPDYVTQTFTWSVSCTQAGACGSLTPDPNNSGAAVYTAPAVPPTGCTSSNCVTVTATSTLNPSAPSGTSANVNVVKTRVSGTYAFRFSGYDAAQNQLEMAGSVTFSTAGLVTSGVVDEVIATGASAGHNQYSITSGSYVPSTASDNNTNDTGTLSLTFNGAVAQFRAVLNSSGELRMIESDGNGTGSGVMQKTATSQITASKQTFAFLFTGVDPIGKRVAFAGLVTLDGSASGTTQGNISGMMDINDGGVPATYAGMAGKYGPIPTNGVWPMTLSAGGNTWVFNFYVGSGQTQNASSPLTLFAILTDPPSVHPLLGGTMAFQDPNTTYDKTALSSSAVAHLDGLNSTGTNTSVALIVASGDANGNMSGSFDALNFSTLPASVSAQNFTCTYAAGTGGRYVITLLGNGTTCTAPALPFVFYATGANRGFLLDQSSSAVMVGAMDPQASSSSVSGTFADSALPGTFAAATVSNGSSGVNPVAANLLLTFQGFSTSGTPIANAAATLYDPLLEPLAAGTYTIQFNGTGAITLTPQSAAHADSFVFYAIDTSHFWIIQTQDTTGNAPADPAVTFMQQ